MWLDVDRAFFGRKSVCNPQGIAALSENLTILDREWAAKALPHFRSRAGHCQS
jgi:hypothetical protein